MITFIVPHHTFQKDDKFTTGIIYMPVQLAYVFGFLKSKNIEYQVIDVFGESPNNLIESENFFLMGLDPNSIISRINQNSKYIAIFANHIINFRSIELIYKSIASENSLSSKKLILIENTQSVTGFSLSNFHKKSDLKFDYIFEGDPENKILNLISKNSFNENRDVLDIENKILPDWSKIPLENYWQIGHAHGPLTNERYLPILTSRGCPYPCKFCVIPYTNNRRWRAREPFDIYQELKFLNQTFDVKEFHLEDLNPTVNDKRVKDLCQLIINSDLKINWKIVAGTKVESIKSEQTVRLMKDSGCSYVSISPESGSKKILKKMEKPFDIHHALKIIKFFNKYEIKSQGCFVFGFPSENFIDLLKTYILILKLTIHGMDEIAIFIITPIPGSGIEKDFNLDDLKYSEMTFSPVWRKDYLFYYFFRLFSYLSFLIFKSIFHPIKFFKNITNFYLKKFELKMEMVPYKYLKYRNLTKNYAKNLPNKI